VILLDHRVIGQISTRRLRVVKYRGTTHGTNEYPFLIDEKGIAVMPITSSGMDYDVSNRRVTSGIPELDEMLGGKGYFEGSTAMLSGTAGTGKTSVAAHLADATCQRGERCMYFSFEESEAQILRNMNSIGVKLEPHVKKGFLKFYATRPTVHGLEMHLLVMHKMIEEFGPSVVVVDPISNLQSAGTGADSSSMLIRLVDFLRKKHITAFFINLTGGGAAAEATDQAISSLVDTWLLLRDIELGGERNRAMYVLKSRGMAHSNQVREFIIGSNGVKLIPAYFGPSGVLTGSARLSQEAAEKAEKQTAKDEVSRRQMLLERQRRAMEAKVSELRAEFEEERLEFERMSKIYALKSEQVETDRRNMKKSRHAGGKSKREPGQ
jgi:circadian clock protein KaiC